MLGVGVSSGVLLIAIIICVCCCCCSCKRRKFRLRKKTCFYIEKKTCLFLNIYLNQFQLGHFGMKIEVKERNWESENKDKIKYVMGKFSFEQCITYLLLACQCSPTYWAYLVAKRQFIPPPLHPPTPIAKSIFRRARRLRNREINRREIYSINSRYWIESFFV